MIGLPKTIDNDLWGTDMTFGFQSAVDIATNAIDCIHTTASSHGRVFIVEVMGHKVGWLTLHAGIAGGADIILIPEIPYDLDKVVKKIKERTKNGSRFSILAVAEGAISKEQAALSKKEYKKYLEERATKYQSVAYEIGAENSGDDRSGDPCDSSGPYAARRHSGPVRPRDLHKNRRTCRRNDQK